MNRKLTTVALGAVLLRAALLALGLIVPAMAAAASDEQAKGDSGRLFLEDPGRAGRAANPEAVDAGPPPRKAPKTGLKSSTQKADAKRMNGIYNRVLKGLALEKADAEWAKAKTDEYLRGLPERRVKLVAELEEENALRPKPVKHSDADIAEIADAVIAAVKGKLVDFKTQLERAKIKQSN